MPSEMAALASVFAVVLISMLINRIAAIALALTGMSREEARFQARAAMSGVGLTTRSAEDIVGHPVRRRIVFWLMVVGSAGIVTAVASLVLSFNGGSAGQRLSRAGVLIGALSALWLVSRMPLVDRALSSLIGWALRKRGYVTRDYGTLFALSGDYAVAELVVREGDWVVDKTLRELRLRDEGLIVVGIRSPDVGYLGVPGADTEIRPHDTLVVYGREAQIAELDRRSRGPSGDRVHRQACLELAASDTSGRHRAESERRHGGGRPAGAARRRASRRRSER
jgi:hypothetical protein